MTTLGEAVCEALYIYDMDLVRVKVGEFRETLMELLAK